MPLTLSTIASTLKALGVWAVLVWPPVTIDGKQDHQDEPSDVGHESNEVPLSRTASVVKTSGRDTQTRN